MRCFEVDTSWVQHLLEGAASVGGPGVGADPAFTPKANLCGVLVRSSAVSDFPSLVVTGLDSQGKQVPSLKTTRLARTQELGRTGKDPAGDRGDGDAVRRGLSRECRSFVCANLVGSA